MTDKLPTESKWIRFEYDTSVTKRKTAIWSVLSKEGNFVLGQIKWFGRWRGYAFFPKEQTVFEKQCLSDIADFIETANTIHREKRKLNKEQEK